MSRQECALHKRQEATKTDGTTLTESRAKNDLKTACMDSSKKVNKQEIKNKIKQIKETNQTKTQKIEK